jgi:hypothetical protein
MIKGLRNSWMFFFLILSTSLSAQNITEYQKHFELHIQPTTSVIKIDGILDEPVWSSAGMAKDFHKIRDKMY